MSPRIPIDSQRIADFCRKWRISRLELFGSVVRDDFRADSDVDVLISFEPEDLWDLFDLVAMKEELEGIFGRPVDLLTRRAVEASRNPHRRDAILSSATPLYAA
ncbi:MAG: nucleotidyltransferase family protein [Thermoanaerobaculia bacterium]|nr:nucleotidyltransferase family protein [Thermoanaerobaculia bacterium]